MHSLTLIVLISLSLNAAHGGEHWSLGVLGVNINQQNFFDILTQLFPSLKSAIDSMLNGEHHENREPMKHDHENHHHHEVNDHRRPSNEKETHHRPAKADDHPGRTVADKEPTAAAHHPTEHAGPSTQKPKKDLIEIYKKNGNLMLPPDVKLQIQANQNALRQKLASGQVPGQPKAEQMIRMLWCDVAAPAAIYWSTTCKWTQPPLGEFCGVDAFPNMGANMYGELVPDGKTEWTVDEALALSNRALDAWFDEHKNFDYSTGQCSGPCGNYTQLARADIYLFGCGFSICEKGIEGLYDGKRSIMGVCIYGPSTNLDPLPPYPTKPGPCPPARPQLMNNLCTGNGQFAPYPCEDKAPKEVCEQEYKTTQCWMCNNAKYWWQWDNCAKTCQFCVP